MKCIVLIALCVPMVVGLILDSGGDTLVLVEQERQARLHLEAKVAELETIVNRLDSLVSAECAVHCSAPKTVAFMAQLSRQLDNPANGHVVVFDDIITNTGNAYNNVHGIFTAPANGTYSFTLVASTPNDAASHSLHLLIKLNKATKGYIFFDGNTQYWFRRSTSVVLALQQSDEVWVEVDSVSGNHALGGCCFHTHFSGFLLH